MSEIREHRGQAMIEPASVEEIKEFMEHFDVAGEYNRGVWSYRMGRAVLDEIGWPKDQRG